MEKMKTGGAIPGGKLKMEINIGVKGKNKILFLIEIFRPISGNMIKGIGEIKLSDGRLY